MVGIGRAISSGTGAARSKTEKLLDACVSNKKDIGKPTLTPKEIDDLSEKLYNALSGFSYREKEVKEVFESLPTVPDICALNTAFSKNFGQDLYKELAWSITTDREWVRYVSSPLIPAIRDTKVQVETTKTDTVKQPTETTKTDTVKQPPKSTETSGTSPQTTVRRKKYKPCSKPPYTPYDPKLPNKQGCFSEDIRRAQGCLGMPAKYQTGNFGTITQGYLNDKFPNNTNFRNSLTLEDIDVVCGKNTEDVKLKLPRQQDLSSADYQIQQQFNKDLDDEFYNNNKAD